MKFGIFLASFIALFTLGCHAQAPVSPSQSAMLTWTQSASCTASTPCSSYLVSRASVASASTGCPATAGTTYAQIATLSTANATSFTDSTITATGYYCWTVQAQQGSPLSTGAASAASNSGAALLVTEPPLAPGVPSAAAQSADLVKPALPESPTAASAYNLALNAPIRLTVRVR